jgi:hypothetical protein
LDRWCRNHLGSGIDEELFRFGHLSTVIGMRLNSGPQVVVKVRRPSDRLMACAYVHRPYSNGDSRALNLSSAWRPSGSRLQVPRK